MRNYVFGRALEYQIMAELEAYGYFCVRSSGSKGPVDVVGFREDGTVFVQCKRQRYVAPGEWNTLYFLACRLNAIPLLAHKRMAGKGNQYFRILEAKKQPRTRIAPQVPWIPSEPGQGKMFE